MQLRDQIGLYKLNWNLAINASSWRRGASGLRLRAVNPIDDLEMGATETSLKFRYQSYKIDKKMTALGFESRQCVFGIRIPVFPIVFCQI